MQNSEKLKSKKAEVLALDLHKEVAKASRQNFVQGDRTLLSHLEAIYGVERVKVARNINLANWKRKNRVQDKIGDMVRLGFCQFLTLTFRDDVLSSTSKETRRQYVRKFLKRNCAVYVANIDFGDDGHKRTYKDAQGVERVSTAREHYHALVVGDSIDYKAWHKYGALKAEKVRDTEKDAEKVSKYVAKLSAHAMKVNGGNAPRLIYSRGFTKGWTLVPQEF